MISACMNNHINFIAHYSRQKKENQIYRKSKEMEQRKESQKTQTKQQGHVILSTELQSTALMLKPQRLRKIVLGFD